jgi:hypothetical protein
LKLLLSRPADRQTRCETRNSQDAEKDNQALQERPSIEHELYENSDYKKRYKHADGDQRGSPEKSPIKFGGPAPWGLVLTGLPIHVRHNRNGR